MGKNIVWHKGKVNAQNREKLNGHKGACLWFTGLSGSGKSTIANELEAQLNRIGVHTYLMDGDNIRHGLSSDLAFSIEEIQENNRRIGEVARLFVDAGMIIITSFISPFRKDRNKVRSLMPEERFIEIHVDCDIKVCEKRDPKGLYKKARKGLIKNFIGISSPYEPPLKPEILLQNENKDKIKDNVKKVIDYLTSKGII
ncbi:MAG: adenylyl-sulfate kinase [Bacteroidetes bacterium]|nr:adenylyl-sulfate kinase [Bacteroidota bacterium]